MDSAWVGVVGAAVGMGGAIVINYLKLQYDYKMSEKKIQHEDKLNKRETRINRFEGAFETIEILRRIATEVSSAVTLRHDISKGLQVYAEEKPLERLPMLISFYAPELIDDMQPLVDSFIDFMVEAGKVLEFSDQSDEEISDHIVSCENLRRKVAKDAVLLQDKLAEYYQDMF